MVEIIYQLLHCAFLIISTWMTFTLAHSHFLMKKFIWRNCIKMNKSTIQRIKAVFKLTCYYLLLIMYFFDLRIAILINRITYLTITYILFENSRSYYGGKLWLMKVQEYSVYLHIYKYTGIPIRVIKKIVWGAPHTHFFNTLLLA